ncbi:MAG: pyruvate synthase subunit beta [Candidatus Nealsonbacteria bacterium]|nr:pyruvate synthase subunit beta [Candidatus Nealsonbacteria bacterium]
MPEQIYAKPAEEMLWPGHSFCPGCAEPVLLRQVLSVLAEDPSTSLGESKKKIIIFVTPASCKSVCASFEANAEKVFDMASLFMSAPDRATGLRMALDCYGIQDALVVPWMGDGAAFDIGFGSLSAAATRNENILVFCHDNEAYMNTGIQQSGSTPREAWTTVTTEGKKDAKKDIVRILADHGVPYVATAAVAFLDDLREKVRKAKDIQGFRFIHLFTPCPTGWRLSENLSIEISRLAVASRVFPLYEVFGGKKYVINKMPDKIPVDDYLRLQGRFRHLIKEKISEIQKSVDSQMDYLKKLSLIKSQA